MITILLVTINKIILYTSAKHIFLFGCKYNNIYKVKFNKVVLMLISLREKSPNTDFFLVRIFLYSVRIQENTDQKKLHIWTLFTQCLVKCCSYILILIVELILRTLLKEKLRICVMRCAIWYHLYNLKNVKNTHGGSHILFCGVEMHSFHISKTEI